MPLTPCLSKKPFQRGNSSNIYAFAAVLCLLFLLSADSCASGAATPRLVNTPSSFDEPQSQTILGNPPDTAPWTDETLDASFGVQSSLSLADWEAIAGITPAATPRGATTPVFVSREALPPKRRLRWRKAISSPTSRVAAAVAAGVLLLLGCLGFARQAGKAREGQAAAAAAAAQIRADLVSLQADAEELARLLDDEEAAELISKLNGIIVAAREDEQQQQQQQQQKQRDLDRRLERLRGLYDEVVQVVDELGKHTRFFLLAAVVDGASKRRCTQKAQQQLVAMYDRAGSCLRDKDQGNPLQIHELASRLTCKATVAELLALHSLKNEFEARVPEQQISSVETTGETAAAAAAGGGGGGGADEAARGGQAEMRAGMVQESLITDPREVLSKAVETVQAAARKQQRLSILMREGVGWLEEAQDASVAASRAGIFELMIRLSFARMHLQVLQLNYETSSIESNMINLKKDDEKTQAAIASLDKNCLKLQQFCRKMHGKPDPLDALDAYQQAQSIFRASINQISAAFMKTGDDSSSLGVAAILSQLKEAATAVTAQRTGKGLDEDVTRRYRELLMSAVSNVVAEAEFAEFGFISPSVKKQLGDSPISRFFLPFQQSHQLLAAWNAASAASSTTLNKIKAKHMDLDEAENPSSALQAASSLMGLAFTLTTEAATASSHASACKAWFKVERVLNGAFDDYANAMEALEALIREQQQQEQQEQQQEEGQVEALLQRVQQQLEVPPESSLQRRAREALQESRIADAALLAADVAMHARDIERYIRDRRSKQH
ncbi:hypothetical protein Emag_003971 [Eimeria magna]